MMRDQLLADLAALERHVATRVQIVRVLIDRHGVTRKRVATGSFSMPPAWQPPSLEDQIANAKGRKR